MMGPRIKLARSSAGFTMESLAELLELSKQSIKEWEAGRRQPSVDNLKVLAEKLRKPVGWFFEEEPMAAPESPSVPNDGPPSERTLLEMLARQQDLLAEQQSMMERQRQDVARLTELLARQQEIYVAEREWQQKLATRQADKQQAMIDELRAEIDLLKARPPRGKQLLDPPAVPSRAGGQ